jgi:EmrB/QacA subfamily drug resistance transporter
MSDADTALTTTPSGTEPDPRRWGILAVVVIAQLMVVLDASIVTIALPSAQRALHISVANRQWVITAYTVAFGGLLLLGGRIADFGGRKRMFLIGLLGFAGASALGGFAADQAMLFGARALQGAFAALMAPAALSILTITFQSDPKERAKAFGAYGAVSGAGGAIGVLAGGVLTQYASWRWCLLVNVPIALLAAVAATRVVHESRASGTTRYDIPGAVLSTAGLIGLVYGFTKAETDGWTAAPTLILLSLAVVLLVAFVIQESRSSHPLLPLRVVAERNRGGSFLATLLLGAGLFAMFVFLSYYMQSVLQYSALKAGLAFLPFAFGIIVAAALSTSLVPRVGPRLPMAGGIFVGAIGLAWLSQIGVHTSYWTNVLPQELLMSLGLGLAFPALSSTALTKVKDRDAGVASALVNTTQQVGGSLGTALLNTVAATATASYVVAHGRAATQAGVVHGFAVAFAVGAGFLLLGAIVSAVLVTATKQDLAVAAGAPAPATA